MTTATLLQAPAKGLRQQFADLRAALSGFSSALYAAQGREFALQDTAAAPLVSSTARQQAREALFGLANKAESTSPTLSAELRFLASRG